MSMWKHREYLKKVTGREPKKPVPSIKVGKGFVMVEGRKRVTEKTLFVDHAIRKTISHEWRSIMEVAAKAIVAYSTARTHLERLEKEGIVERMLTSKKTILYRLKGGRRNEKARTMVGCGVESDHRL